MRTRVSQVTPEIARHSPRNGFNGFLRALPGDRAFLPPSPARMASRELDASVGASGPHDFAVRKPALSSLAPPASTASRPAAVTIACRPSVGRNGDGYKSDLGKARTEIFLRKGLDTRVAEQPVGQIRRSPVQPLSQKYSASHFTQITFRTLAVPSHRGAARDRHGRGAGCGGRGRRQRRERRLADGEVVWS